MTQRTICYSVKIKLKSATLASNSALICCNHYQLQSYYLSKIWTLFRKLSPWYPPLLRKELRLFWESFNKIKSLDRGYYMATRRYKISPGVLKSISQVSTMNKWNIFQQLSKWRCNVLLITNDTLNYFTFAAKGTIYYVTIATVIFSQVKVTCYWLCEDIIFLRES